MPKGWAAEYNLDQDGQMRYGVMPSREEGSVLVPGTTTSQAPHGSDARDASGSGARFGGFGLNLCSRSGGLDLRRGGP